MECTITDAENGQSEGDDFQKNAIDAHRKFMDVSCELIDASKRILCPSNAEACNLSNEAPAGPIPEVDGTHRKPKKNRFYLSVPTHFVERPKKKEEPTYMKKLKQLSDDRKFKLIEDTLLKVKEAERQEKTEDNNINVHIPLNNIKDESEMLREDVQMTSQSSYNISDETIIDDVEHSDLQVLETNATFDEGKDDLILEEIDDIKDILDKKNKAKQTRSSFSPKISAKKGKNKSVKNPSHTKIVPFRFRSPTNRHCCVDVTEHYRGPAYYDDGNNNERHLHLPAMRMRQSLTARPTANRGRGRTIEDSETCALSSRSLDSKEVDVRIQEEIRRHMEKLKLQKKWKNRVNCVHDFIRHQNKTWADRVLLRPNKITLLASKTAPPFFQEMTFVSSGQNDHMTKLKDFHIKPHPVTEATHVITKSLLKHMQ